MELGSKGWILPISRTGVNEWRLKPEANREERRGQRSEVRGQESGGRGRGTGDLDAFMLPGRTRYFSRLPNVDWDCLEIRQV
jgi:hypothetical protein